MSSSMMSYGSDELDLLAFELSQLVSISTSALTCQPSLNDSEVAKIVSFANIRSNECDLAVEGFLNSVKRTRAVAPSSKTKSFSGKYVAREDSITSITRLAGELRLPITRIAPQSSGELLDLVHTPQEKDNGMESKLAAWTIDHLAWPYPTKLDYANLLAQTGMTLKQVKTWFVNSRKRSGWAALFRERANGDKATLLYLLQESSVPDEDVDRVQKWFKSKIERVVDPAVEEAIEAADNPRPIMRHITSGSSQSSLPELSSTSSVSESVCSSESSWPASAVSTVEPSFELDGQFQLVNEVSSIQQEPNPFFTTLEEHPLSFLAGLDDSWELKEQDPFLSLLL